MASPKAFTQRVLGGEATPGLAHIIRGAVATSTLRRGSARILTR
jgi:hypothetical protein